jgi:hypothetical protein
MTIDTENVIDRILECGYYILIEKNEKDIQDYYDSLRKKTDNLFYDYDDYKYKSSKESLENKFEEFAKANKALFLLNRVLLYKMQDKADREKYETKFYATNTFINKVQNQYLFDISYKIQQIDSRRTTKHAIVALILTVFFGLVSLLVTIFYANCPKKESPDPIVCMCNSALK